MCEVCANSLRNRQARTVEERYGAEFKFQDPGKWFLPGSRTEENLVSLSPAPNILDLKILVVLNNPSRGGNT
jgi:hypothetical protein